MIPIPAIDIKQGKVVRLFRGNFKEEKVYFEKPEEVARTFEGEGAEAQKVFATRSHGGIIAPL